LIASAQFNHSEAAWVRMFPIASSPGSGQPAQRATLMCRGVKRIACA
jgi:hypothetical protein